MIPLALEMILERAPDGLRGRTPTSRACRRNRPSSRSASRELTSSARPLAASQASAIATSVPPRQKENRSGAAPVRLRTSPMRLDDALEDIILDALVAMLLVRVDPADDEHRAALVDQPFDQARPGHEVDHVDSGSPAAARRAAARPRPSRSSASYWISWNRSFSNTTSPGVAAIVLPFSNASGRCGAGRCPCPLANILEQVGEALRPGSRRWFPWCA